MTSFLAYFFAWSGPNTVAALVSASTAWWLLNRKTDRNLGHLLVATGAAVVSVLGLSALAALAHVEPIGSAPILGIIAGLISAFLIRERD